MRGFPQWIAFVITGTLCAQSTPQATPQATPKATTDRRQFVACPILRDTKTQPCWLVEHQGETYFLGIQGGVVDDFYPPQLNHELLVEGAVTAGPRVCGGIPLRPLKVSVLPEVSPACNTMLPAEEGLVAPERVRTAIPGPSWVKVDSPASITVYFDFDNDFLSLHSTGALQKLADYAKQNRPSTVFVKTYRGATLLSNHTTLTEKANIAELRARKVQAILEGLGMAAQWVMTSWSMEPTMADGVNDPWSRRAVITVTTGTPVVIE